ncbi:MAG: CAP domain-containing protein, partial [Bifidobacteriaceae bacterium]|nr:CAP domain-containing protein [Bifidobacteriaceae bacterium]
MATNVINRFVPFALVVGLVGTLGLGTQPADAVPSVLVPMAIDTTNRTAVSNAYINTLLPALTTAVTWNGNKANCVTGSPTAQPSSATGTASTTVQTATLQAINYYREMAGLQPVTENTTGSNYALQAALIMHAQGALSHSPDNTWACYSSDGAAGASSSNISLGASSAGAIQGQVDDYGAGNTAVGHRRWILYPPLSQVGMGSTSNSMALKVFGTGTANGNTRPSGGTAWPSAGYFPYEVYPSSGRWSYTLPSPASFTDATVTVTKDSTTYTTSVIGLNGSYGDRAIVWTVDGITRPAQGAVDTYTVTISGITGASVTSATYNVMMINAAEATVASVDIDGTAVVGNTLTANVGAPTPSDATLSYTWYRDGTTVVASGSTYTLKVADAGHSITVKVTASKSGWTAFPATSPGVTVAALPTVSGTVVDRQGGSVAGYSLTYRNVTCDSSKSPIGSTNAISGSVTLTAGGAFSLNTTPGDCLRLSVSNGSTTLPAEVNGTTAPNQYFPAGTSGVTLLVGKGTVTIGSLSISGTPKVGNTLTAAPSAVTPSNASLAYTWWRSSTQVGSGSTYVVTAADVDSIITLKATATYTESYSGITWNSATAQATTSAVQSGTFITVPVPNISGSAAVGVWLTASPGTWVPTPDSYGYQWFRNGVAISGATNYRYHLTPADAGTTITVKVTGNKAGYTTATSAASAGLTVPAWRAVSGTVIHRQGTSLAGWKINYDNFTCGSTPTDIVTPHDLYGTSTLTASGTFSIELPPGECLRITVQDGAGYSVRSTWGSDDLTYHYPAAGTSGVQLYVGTGTVTISLAVTGTAKVGQTLTANVGTFPTQATWSVAWYRGSTLVGSGTTYVVKADDVGSSLTAKVTATYYTWTSANAQASSAMVPAVATSTPTPTKTTTPTPSKSTTPTPAGPTST